MQDNQMDQNNTDDFSGRKNKQKTDAKNRLMRRLKRKLRHFIQDLTALCAVIVITAVIGSAVLSQIHTPNGQSLYDMLAKTIKTEIDNPENDGAVSTAVAAVRSSVTASTPNETDDSKEKEPISKDPVKKEDEFLPAEPVSSEEPS